MSFFLYKQLQNPTGVEYSQIGYFISDAEQNLVISKNCLLQVFRIRKTVQDVSLNASSASISSNQQKTGSVLDLILEKKVFGHVDSISKIRFMHHKRDALILTFRDAKVSILEFDPHIYDFSILSLHFYEDPKFQDGRRQFSSLPIMKLDNKQRCGAMLIYDSRMVIFQFKTQSLLEEDLDDSMEINSDKPLATSYVVNLNELKIKHPKDYVFLDGYIDPTLLILYEPSLTWTGQYKPNKNSCCLIALSLNLSQQSHTVIWTTDLIPYDCHRLISLSEPSGGAIVWGVNHLLYFNQNSRFGLALNDYAFVETELPFPLEKSPIQMALDGANYAFLRPNVLLVSLKGGELFIFKLIVDSRTIQHISINRTGNSVLSSCISTISSDLFFLGSRLGDSLLIKYKEKVVSSETENEPIDMNENLATNESEQNNNENMETSTLDDEETLIYQSSTANTDKNENITFQFSICDSLINIGPIGDISIGESRDHATSSQTNQNEKTIEIISCSGSGKNGSLYSLKEGIIPELFTAFELPDCHASWTIYDATKESNDPIEKYHNYLILSKSNSTMVLETGEDLQEITNKVQFYVEGPTLNMNSLLSGQRIVQVYTTGMRLFTGVTKLEEITFTQPILFCSICDPYVAILFENHEVRLWSINLNHPDKLSELTASFEKIDSIITAISIAIDDKNLFLQTDTIVSNPTQLETTPMDDEAILYGNSSKNMNGSTSSSTESISHLCIISRENGRIEIYHLPNMKLLFHCPNFSFSPSILIPNPDLSEFKEKKKSEQKIFRNDTENFSEPFAIELNFVSFDSHGFSYLFGFLNTGDLLIYKHFTFQESNQTLTRFVKVENDIVWRKHQSMNSNISNKNSFRYPQIHVYENISDRKGVFITGHRPTWIFTEKQYIRFHPMYFDGEIKIFSPLHNASCLRGFIYFTSKNMLKICQLPSFLQFESSWITRKIVNLRCTPHRILYNPSPRTYVVSISSKIQRNIREERDPEDDEDENLEITPSQKSVLMHTFNDQFEIRLISPINLDITDTFKLEKFESVLTMKFCNLKVNSANGDKQFLVIGTGFDTGEDVTCKGRIIIFEIYQMYGMDSGYYLQKFKLIHEKEQKGPISAVTSVSGYLLVAIGSKLILFDFSTGEELKGMAFYDASIYVVSMNTIKNFVLCGDIYHSIFFLRWKEQSRQLVLLSKDYQLISAHATEFILNQKALNFVVSDHCQNLLIYSYGPQILESRGGQIMVVNADFHLGQFVDKFARVPLRGFGKIKTGAKQGAVFGTHDGAVGIVCPIEEMTFKRLFALQARMITAIPHFAGLNPKSFRIIKTSSKLVRNRRPNILDGELLWKYLSLKLSDQRRLAQQIGTTPEQIYDNLFEILHSLTIF